MNARELYLAWLRSTHPDLYQAVLRKLAGKPRSLGGLGQDLTDSLTAPDLSSALSDIQIDPTVTAAVDAAANQASSTGADLFTSIANDVSSIANTYLTTSAQSNLLNINTQRARQGLGPLTSYGVPVTAASLMPANAQVLAMERKIAGVGPTNWVLIGGAALVGLVLLTRTRARR